MSPFYNTIKDPNKEELDKKTVTQEDWILWFFTKYPGSYTPFDIQEEMRRFGKAWPITSVRRAMTDLTKEGRLVKTENKKQGPYGISNFTWKIKDQLSLF